MSCDLGPARDLLLSVLNTHSRSSHHSAVGFTVPGAVGYAGLDWAVEESWRLLSKLQAMYQ